MEILTSAPTTEPRLWWWKMCGNPASFDFCEMRDSLRACPPVSDTWWRHVVTWLMRGGARGVRGTHAQWNTSVLHRGSWKSHWRHGKMYLNRKIPMFFFFDWPAEWDFHIWWCPRNGACGFKSFTMGFFLQDSDWSMARVDPGVSPWGCSQDNCWPMDINPTKGCVFDPTKV